MTDDDCLRPVTCETCVDSTFACPFLRCVDRQCLEEANTCLDPMAVCAGKSCGDPCSTCTGHGLCPATDMYCDQDLTCQPLVPSAVTARAFRTTIACRSRVARARTWRAPSASRKRASPANARQRARGRHRAGRARRARRVFFKPAVHPRPMASIACRSRTATMALILAPASPAGARAPMSTARRRTASASSRSNERDDSMIQAVSSGDRRAEWSW